MDANRHKTLQEKKNTYGSKCVDMAATGAHLRSGSHFLYSICLDVFTDPCGQNCKECITRQWNTKLGCSMCKQGFPSKPQLKINCLVTEMVHQFRHQGSNEPEVVLCDICTGTKVKAVKSCLECLTSYCETHLDHHLKAPSLRRHQLIEPVENLEDRICTKHGKPLELFCKTDQTCVCLICSVSGHEGHKFVSLKEEYEEKKVALKTTDAGVQQMIQERQVKIQEIRRSLIMSQKDADREKAEVVEVFSALKKSVERDLDKFLKEMKDKQMAAQRQAEDLITELEEEIFELVKSRSLADQLSVSENHLHLLQNLSALKAAPTTKDWMEVKVCPPLYERVVVRTMEKLEKMLAEQMKELRRVALMKKVELKKVGLKKFELKKVELKKLELKKKVGLKKKVELKEVEQMEKVEPKKKMELKKVQQFAVDLTLDPDTAHPNLILSEDGKQVHHGDDKKNLPEKSERFSYAVNVLGKESFSSGRFYFEVQVKGKTKWTLGVVRESINRKGCFTVCPQNGFWTIWSIKRNQYLANSVFFTVASPPEKVGVFVDYDEGLVSFYDTDAADLLYSFTDCSFTDKLRPFFCPHLNEGGRNSAPLIICPVNQTS